MQGIAGSEVSEGLACPDSHVMQTHPMLTAGNIMRHRPRVVIGVSYTVMKGMDALLACQPYGTQHSSRPRIMIVLYQTVFASLSIHLSW